MASKGTYDKRLAAELRARWDDETTAAANLALEKEGKGRLDVFPPVDGRTDLRGLVVTPMLRRRRLQTLDLSFSRWPIPAQLIQCELTDCRFDHGEVGANLDRKFVRCSFVGSKMSRVLLRGSYEDCDFTAATFRNGKATEVTFTRCRFRGANLRKAQLVYCKFVACDFTDVLLGDGSLSRSTFVDSPIGEDALGNTLMEKVDWR